MTLNEICEAFADHMRRNGIKPPDNIEADGEIHRFPGGHDDKDCFYPVDVDDAVPGVHGDWHPLWRKCSECDYEWQPEVEKHDFNLCRGCYINGIQIDIRHDWIVIQKSVSRLILNIYALLKIRLWHRNRGRI